MSLRASLGWSIGAAILVGSLTDSAAAREYKYSQEERIILTRDLTAEFATAKITVPRAKKPLPVDAETGKTDLEQWSEAHDKFGPAALMGDIVQITKIEFESKRIVFDLNGGFQGGRKWYERIQVGGGMGGGGQMTPIAQGRTSGQAAGTRLSLEFPTGVPELDAQRIKELLTPVIDFEKHSATEQYVESLPEPVQAAIKENRAIEEMDLDAVLLSMGKPVRKIRETKDGVEYEDWIYGEPPGKVTFVTFRGKTVVKVRESYGSLGGTVAPPLPVQ